MTSVPQLEERRGTTNLSDEFEKGFDPVKGGVDVVRHLRRECSTCGDGPECWGHERGTGSGSEMYAAIDTRKTLARGLTEHVEGRKRGREVMRDITSIVRLFFHSAEGGYGFVDLSIVRACSLEDRSVGVAHVWWVVVVNLPCGLFAPTGQ